MADGQPGGKTEWPQDLKDFANRVFASCTDSNRRLVSEELRKIIFDAFQTGTIHSTDWSSVRLNSLGGSSSSGSSSSINTPILSSSQPPPTKKKKFLSSASNSDDSPSISYTPPHFNSYSSPWDSSDAEDKKLKRARRFEDEQRRFQADQDSSWSPYAAAGGSGVVVGETSLAGRLGVNGGPSGVGKQQSRQSQKTKAGRRAQHQQDIAQPAWTYDATPSGPIGVGQPAGSFMDESIADPNVIDWDRDTVVGLSTKLEKPYLRLTSAPDPKTVRPLAILQQTLELLKRKWRTENNYTYICDQFKSMRQDLTVQRIKNDFTVKVYEIHARIALEKGDLGEYNQCQSQLRTLYGYDLPGSKMEFLAYRILYLLHTRNRREVSALMAELTPTSKKNSAVHHALQVRLSLSTGNYHRFFKLYLNAPNMNAYIMDHFVERERVVALSILARSYRPSLPLAYISTELGFTDVNEAHEFLDKHGIAIYIDPTPAELAAAVTANTGAGGGQQQQQQQQKKRKKNSGVPPSVVVVPIEQRKWDCKSALAGIIAAGDKYRKIDIKGQI